MVAWQLMSLCSNHMPDFIDFVRTLNYSSFREFQQDQLPPLNSSDSSRAAAAAATTASGDGEAAGEEHCLNPWQVRHAMLVVRAVKEVDELRFVLCPR